MGAIALSSVALTCAGTGLLWFTWRLYCHRAWIHQLRKDGMPMPAWSWISGHVLYLFKHNRGLPALASVNLAFYEMAASFQDDEMFLLDIWPLGEPMLVIFNPEAAVQVCQKLNLPKGELNETMIRPITGGLTLLSMNGDMWKTWRTLFNPGFSNAVMGAQIPQIVDATSSFCERLSHIAKGQIVHLDELTTRLTFEIILKVSLNADLGPNYHDHPFVKSMGNIVKWHSFWDPRVLANPLRHVVNWYNSRIVNSWIQSALEQRYETLKQARISSKPAAQSRVKSVMDLAIEGYIDGKAGQIPAHLDPDFVRMATHQMRLFLFAGNDTTSSTIVFAYHMLSQHPHILAQLRSEHDDVFGTDTSTTATQLKSDPALLSKCKVTLAVIKETLRLYAPAATMRTGNAECFLTTHQGVSVPTNNVSILVQHHAMHRNARVWLRAREFLPERWLVGPEHALHPHNGAWRPFELGPRSCIGQTLSLNEIKIVLVMTVRCFDVVPAYEDFERMLGGSGVVGCGVGVSVDEKKMWYGDRAYQTEKAGAHPSLGYPCYVASRVESAEPQGGASCKA